MAAWADLLLGTGVVRDQRGGRFSTTARKMRLRPYANSTHLGQGGWLVAVWPGHCFRCLRVERFVERRNIGIVDLGILHAINPRQVAVDRFLLTAG